MFFEVINYITYTVFRERKREREKKLLDTERNLLESILFYSGKITLIYCSN